MERMTSPAESAISKGVEVAARTTLHTPDRKFHRFVQQNSGVIERGHLFTLEAAVIVLTQLQFNVPKNYASRLKLLRAAPMQRL
jgi:hypothetical protein